MSWADDIRCLYCDGRLPLYRKITNGQFCSTAHRKNYWKEQERLAVERLHQTHDSLQAYKPRIPVEAILGQTEEYIEPAAVPVVEPVAEGFEANDARPAWLTFANSGDVPLGTFVRDSKRLMARWPADHVLLAQVEMLPATISPRTVVGLFRLQENGMAGASRIAIPLFTPIITEARILAPGFAPTNFKIYPVKLPAALLAIDPGEPVVLVEAPAPLAEKLFALAKIRIFAGNHGLAQYVIEPLGLVSSTLLPLFNEQVLVRLGTGTLVRDERLRALSMDHIAPAPGPSTDHLRALDLRTSSEAAQLTIATPPVRPRLRLASGRRYSVETPGTLKPVAPIGIPVERIAAVMSVTLPERQAKVLRAAAGAAPVAPVREPGAAGLLRLECNSAPSDSPNVRAVPDILSMPQPPVTAPVRPASKLEPHVDFMANPPASTAVPEGELNELSSNVWQHAVDFWNRAPRDLKMLAFAIPILFGLALHPALPKVRVAAPMAASGFQHNVKNVVDTQLATFKQTVYDRAAIALDEDFRSGLDDWASRGDTSTEWSFDATGFVRPGTLALYRPSMNLTDYQMQFLGMIDQKALSWVVRAADFDNYYVVKLEVLKAGPLPTIGLTRYAVVNGKADTRADVVVPIDARNDMLYRVRLDVRGDEFALSVQGQMIDAWSEPRLPRGGIGFFSARGEASRLRWVQVTHQYDMLGRLCAYLAPYNIPSTTGSLEP